ncbi:MULTISPECIES: NAD(P)-binding protein [Arcobacteraceae]|uniref:Amine oxidase domain-containing protein n=1 Tax=Poseidonibacter parvus TaxID=1850254 RepID=A0A1P8KJ57_9BACT|nr:MULTISPECIES: NAD(P)-binding protein [Arcobacteraceae]APW64587.1 hypothetical protein LPB137_01410 [Poseidonibacter parvus]
MKIAIIGAGLSGCNVYKNLKQQNHDITIFEKSRGTGGRLSTKYIDDKFIDHGTPFINTRNYKSANFLDFLDKKVTQNTLRNIDKKYYPTNGINKLCSSLINKKDLITNTRITNAKLINQKWTLTDNTNTIYDDFDFVVFTIPATQILENDFDLDEDTKEQLQNISYAPMASLICYTNNTNTKKIKNQDLNKSELFYKVIDNSTKYDYEDFESYVFHLNKDFVLENMNLEKNELFELIHQKISKEFDINLKEDFNVVEHFWKFAFAKEQLEKDFILNKEKSYGICGDYFNGINLEATYQSSLKISDEINSIYKKG